MLMLTHSVFFLFLHSKRREERSALHINFCLAIAAGIALFLGGLKLTKIRVSRIMKECDSNKLPLLQSYPLNRREVTVEV